MQAAGVRTMEATTGTGVPSGAHLLVVLLFDHRRMDLCTERLEVAGPENPVEESWQRRPAQLRESTKLHVVRSCSGGKGDITQSDGIGAGERQGSTR